MTPTADKRWFHHQINPLGDGVAVASRDVTDRKQAEEVLRALTLVDDLTAVYNRRGFRMLAEPHLRSDPLAPVSLDDLAAGRRELLRSEAPPRMAPVGCLRAAPPAPLSKR